MLRLDSHSCLTPQLTSSLKSLNISNPNAKFQNELVEVPDDTAEDVDSVEKDLSVEIAEVVIEVSVTTSANVLLEREGMLVARVD